MKHRLLAVAAALILSSALPASAAVDYEFIASSSYDVGPGYGQITGSFSYVAPTFVVPNASIPASSLASCIYNSTAGPATCADQRFDNTEVSGYETIGFGGNAPGGPVDIFYYFANTAFATPGVYDSLLLGPSQEGHLIVTAGTPEPAAWSMLIVGLAAIGAVIRRRRSGALLVS